MAEYSIDLLRPLSVGAQIGEQRQRLMLAREAQGLAEEAQDLAVRKQQESETEATFSRGLRSREEQRKIKTLQDWTDYNNKVKQSFLDERAGILGELQFNDPDHLVTSDELAKIEDTARTRAYAKNIFNLPPEQIPGVEQKMELAQAKQEATQANIETAKIRANALKTTAETQAQARRDVAEIHGSYQVQRQMDRLQNQSEKLDEQDRIAFQDRMKAVMNDPSLPSYADKKPVMDQIERELNEKLGKIPVTQGPATTREPTRLEKAQAKALEDLEGYEQEGITEGRMHYDSKRGEYVITPNRWGFVGKGFEGTKSIAELKAELAEKRAAGNLKPKADENLLLPTEKGPQFYPTTWDIGGKQIEGRRIK